MQLGADFVDSFFDGTISKGGEVRTTRRDGGDLQGVVLNLIFRVLNGPDGSVG